MIEPSRWTVAGLHILTSAAATGWAFASHKNNCFNVGPCTGDVNFWIRFADIAFVTFFSTWAALLIGTALYASSNAAVLARACAWIVAFLAPPGLLFTAFWWFNRGIISVAM